MAAGRGTHRSSAKDTAAKSRAAEPGARARLRLPSGALPRGQAEPRHQPPRLAASRIPSLPVPQTLVSLEQHAVSLRDAARHRVTASRSSATLPLPPCRLSFLVASILASSSDARSPQKVLQRCLSTALFSRIKRMENDEKADWLV